MHFKSIIALLALTATSAVLAAPTPTQKPEDCPGQYDWGKKSCNPKPRCDYGWDKEHKKCYEKACFYGYDEHVRGFLSLDLIRSKALSN